MADTSHLHAAASATEGDGINYRGIFWFVVILVLTTLVCQALMWGLFDFFARQAASEDTARPPLAAPFGQPAPPPNLLTDEPGNLRQFRESEDAVLTTYGWIDKNAGTVRIPIDRAKELLIERGIPGGTVMPATPPAKGK